MVDVTVFGAIGDGVTDDTLSIQAAQDAIVLSGYADTLFFPPGKTFLITDTITLDASFVSVDGSGCLIDASPITSGTAIVVTGTVWLPYKQSTTVIEKFRLIGNGAEGDVIGIQFDTSVGGGEGSSHITVRNLNISYFGIGTDYKDRAYLINHYGNDIYYCGVCVNQDGAIVDGGEKLNFNGCTFYNSAIGLKVFGDASDFVFQSCSFDYNVVQLHLWHARVFLTGCHIEGSDYPNIPIFVDGEGYLDINQCWLLSTATLPHTFPHIFKLITPDSTCRVTNSFVNNMQTDSDYWATGDGKLYVENINSYGITQNPLLLSENQNLIRYGDFESASITDDVFISEDTSPITLRFTGANTNVTQSTTEFNSGTKSMRIQKTYGPYSACAVTILVPIPLASVVNSRLFYNKPGATTGDIVIESGYATVSRNTSSIPFIKNDEVRGQIVYSATSAPSGWLSFADGEPYKRSPVWATHYYMRVNLYQWDGSGDSVYIDDVEINIVG